MLRIHDDVKKNVSIFVIAYLIFQIMYCFGLSFNTLGGFYDNHSWYDFLKLFNEVGITFSCILLLFGSRKGLWAYFLVLVIGAVVLAILYMAGEIQEELFLKRIRSNDISLVCAQQRWSFCMEVLSEQIIIAHRCGYFDFLSTHQNRPAVY